MYNGCPGNHQTVVLWRHDAVMWTAGWLHVVWYFQQWYTSDQRSHVRIPRDSESSMTSNIGHSPARCQPVSQRCLATRLQAHLFLLIADTEIVIIITVRSTLWMGDLTRLSYDLLYEWMTDRPKDRTDGRLLGRRTWQQAPTRFSAKCPLPCRTPCVQTTMRNWTHCRDIDGLYLPVPLSRLILPSLVYMLWNELELRVCFVFVEFRSSISRITRYSALGKTLAERKFIYL